MENHDIFNFYWLGGCPSGGKTTIAGELSKATNIPVYHTDEHSLEYGLRINERRPDFHQNVNMDFVNSIVTMSDKPWFDMFIAGLRVTCSIILDDVTKLYSEESVIIEGGVLLPEFIAEIGAERRAVLVNPTYEYLRGYLPKQQWMAYTLSNISDDGYRALFVERLLLKYNLFREYVIETAGKYKIKAVTTAVPESLDNNVRIISQYLFT